MYEYNAIIKGVIDANTVELTVDLGFGVTIKRIFRIIDASAPSQYDQPPDLARSALAKQFAIDNLLHQRVTIQPIKTGKYGRYEAAVTISKTQKNYLELLKENGFC